MRRFSRRQGGNAIKATLEDILKAILDPMEKKMPIFHAIDLARLPPVSAEHCDVSAILRELHGLRHEVRMVTQLRDDFDSLRQEFDTLKRSSTNDITVTQLKDDVVSLRQDIDVLKNINMAGISTMVADDWPQMSTGSVAIGSANGSHSSAMPPVMKRTYGNVAAQLKSGSITERAKRQPVIGKSAKYSQVKTVLTKRQVDVFVSRWLPHTTVSEVSACVDDILEGQYTDVIQCEKLVSKHEHLYSSFFVTVCVPSACMSKVIACLMSADSWPEGLLVKRYFRVKKDGD